MRRRLLVARALIHDPKILVLDELTTGLDPQARHLVWRKLLELNRQGTTVLISTHYMEEAAYLCSKLLILYMGHVVADGTPRELIGKLVGEDVLEIRTVPLEKKSTKTLLPKLGFDPEERAESLLIYSKSGASKLKELREKGFDVIHRPPTLEDVFLRLTGRDLKEE